MSAMLDWSGLPIQVIGMGMAPGTLGQEARAALEEAELIIGSTPHLAAFPELAAEKMPYPSPMSGLPALLQAHAGRRIAVLASGDPLFYGISQNLLRFLPPEHLVFHANISSLQAAFARLGRPWQAAQLLSLHGRPLAGLRAVLQANRLYALLTDRDNSPIAIARIVAEAGFGKSDLWVSEELGTAEERFRHFQTAELADADIEFSPLNVVILETRGPGGVLPEFPGIADERFSSRKQALGTARTSKGKRSRVIPIHPDLKAILADLRRHSDGQVFHGPLGGRLKQDTARNIFRREVIAPLRDRFRTTRGDIGFEHARFHSFRHFFVSQCTEHGCSEGEIMTWTGHRDTELVAHYRHLRQEESRRKIERIPFINSPNHEAAHGASAVTGEQSKEVPPQR